MRASVRVKNSINRGRQLAVRAVAGATSLRKPLLARMFSITRNESEKQWRDPKPSALKGGPFSGDFPE